MPHVSAWMWFYVIRCAVMMWLSPLHDVSYMSRWLCCRLDSGQLQHRFLHHGTLQGERDEAHGGQFQERWRGVPTKDHCEGGFNQGSLLHLSIKYCRLLWRESSGWNMFAPLLCIAFCYCWYFFGWFDMFQKFAVAVDYHFTFLINSHLIWSLCSSVGSMKQLQEVYSEEQTWYLVKIYDR